MTLKEKQEQLDKEMVKCPKCGKDVSWGEIRELGDCLDCYYEYYKRKNKIRPEKAPRNQIQ